uniref:Uncharacterized protein n=1 Tax=Polytomella parva TaxID=51329 RepID=A0A7S0V683_9CHLO|mmetsp:Transcript_30873/g.56166  ORF Transcript_30873/g.56166 Transcript_30873/m.56166 type:complete len:834 (+) Transcript_30873:78-2579(+)
MPSSQGPRLQLKLSHINHPKTSLEHLINKIVYAQAVQIAVPVIKSYSSSENDAHEPSTSLKTVCATVDSFCNEISSIGTESLLRSSGIPCLIRGVYLGHLLSRIFTFEANAQDNLFLTAHTDTSREIQFQLLSFSNFLDPEGPGGAKGQGIVVTGNGDLHMFVLEPVFRKLGLPGQRSHDRPEIFHVKVMLKSTKVQKGLTSLKKVFTAIDDNLQPAHYLCLTRFVDAPSQVDSIASSSKIHADSNNSVNEAALLKRLINQAASAAKKAFSRSATKTNEKTLGGLNPPLPTSSSEVFVNHVISVPPECEKTRIVGPPPLPFAQFPGLKETSGLSMTEKEEGKERRALYAKAGRVLQSSALAETPRNKEKSNCSKRENVLLKEESTDPPMTGDPPDNSLNSTVMSAVANSRNINEDEDSGRLLFYHDQVDKAISEGVECLWIPFLNDVFDIYEADSAKQERSTASIAKGNLSPPAVLLHGFHNPIDSCNSEISEQSAFLVKSEDCVQEKCGKKRKGILEVSFPNFEIAIHSTQADKGSVAHNLNEHGINVEGNIGNADSVARKKRRMAVNDTSDRFKALFDWVGAIANRIESLSFLNESVLSAMATPPFTTQPSQRTPAVAPGQLITNRIQGLFAPDQLSLLIRHLHKLLFQTDGDSSNSVPWIAFQIWAPDGCPITWTDCATPSGGGAAGGVGSGFKVHYPSPSSSSNINRLNLNGNYPVTHSICGSGTPSGLYGKTYRGGVRRAKGMPGAGPTAAIEFGSGLPGSMTIIIGRRGEMIWYRGLGSTDVAWPVATHRMEREAERRRRRRKGDNKRRMLQEKELRENAELNKAKN